MVLAEAAGSPTGSLVLYYLGKQLGKDRRKSNLQPGLDSWDAMYGALGRGGGMLRCYGVRFE